MFWANFLHIYQPARQQPDILEAVVKQSYEPLLNGIKANPKIHLTFNVSGALFELFDKNDHQNLIDAFRRLGKDGRIEFTGSAKYHAFLPFLEDREIVRQIQMNDETNKFYLGEAWQPRGFFPPEMGYDPKLARIISELGFSWIILDEIAASGGSSEVDYSKIYQIKDTKLKVFFRERRMSNLIMSAVARTPETLVDAIDEEFKNNRYLVTGMDGETFGHHRPGLERDFFQMLKVSDFQLVKISELSEHFGKKTEIVPIKSTWASSKNDIDCGVQFLSWMDPKNKIHAWQKELTDMTTSEVYKMSKNDVEYENIRKRLDIDLASDHFWWASAKPWWSLEMIEDGAYHLLGTLRLILNISKEKLERASELYEKIVSTAFHWQRSGKIRQMMEEQNEILRIPFKERTIERGGKEEGVYYAFLDMMKQLEKEAAGCGEYEKAILWRDAIYKLDKKWDIYDTINVIDLVRVEIPHKEIEEKIKKYKKEYREIRGGQPEQRGN